MRFKTSKYGPSRWSGPYWMPGRLRDWLNDRLGHKETPAHVLARFLARFHAGPKTWGRHFVICRAALAQVEELGLTEKQIRLAIAKLEKIGFIARVSGTGKWRWSATTEGCRRAPIFWRFSGVAAAMLAFMLRRKSQGPKFIANARNSRIDKGFKELASGAVHLGPKNFGDRRGGSSPPDGWWSGQLPGEA